MVRTNSKGYPRSKYTTHSLYAGKICIGICSYKSPTYESVEEVVI